MKYLFFLLTPYALLLTVLSGCGYHTSGSVRLQSDLQTIAVPVFFNETFEPSLENAVTSAVKQEFLTNGRLQVVNDPGDADLVLKGTVTSFGLTPLAFDPASSVVLEYRVRIRTSVQLEDRRAQKILWQDPGMETSAEYVVNPDTSANRVAQDHAIAEASKLLGENVVHRVLEGN
jgi:outer membrane lipopolysaccharide assembly protein LptE/RlpB